MLQIVSPSTEKYQSNCTNSSQNESVRINFNPKSLLPSVPEAISDPESDCSVQEYETGKCT